MYYICGLTFYNMEEKIRVRRKKGELLDEMLSIRVKGSVKARLSNYCDKNEVSMSTYVNDLLEKKLPKKLS